MSRKILIAGNWKMYKTTKEAVAFAKEFLELYKGGEHEIAICAPYTQLVALKEAFGGSDVKVGAQNVYFKEEGAFTGEISPAQLDEIGVDYVVIGHSERRQYFNETNETVNLKLKAAFSHTFLPIFCVGEVLAERDAGKEFEVVETQVTEGLSGLPAENVEVIVIAYEPVWAIGTGRTASPEQAEEMCAFIRKTVAKIYGETVANKVRIQYGGSVKPSNATELLTKENIDGALIGGASLVPADLNAIAEF